MEDHLKYQFVAYLDEAGDPSFKRVRPIDEKGGTEWFVLSAVLINARRECEVPIWLAETARRIGDEGTRVLKFSKRNMIERVTICRHIAELPVRIFTVASNKKNLRGYKNPRLEKTRNDHHFYNWMTRILLERMTDYCYRRAERTGQKDKRLKLVFSEEKGMSYSQTAAYIGYLKRQIENGAPVLRRWVPRAEVMDWRLVEAFPHSRVAGLQYADISASSFYQAVDNIETGPCNTRYAEALKPRVAINADGTYRDYGVILQPHKDWKISIGEDQRAIFRIFGYDFIPRMNS